MSEDTVTYWRERALDAESELKFIKTEYGDADSEELTRDALVLKARVLEIDCVASRNEREKLLRELEVLRKALQQVTTGVIRQNVLRSSCEVSADGIYRVHLREYDWDRLFALCRDAADSNL